MIGNNDEYFSSDMVFCLPKDVESGQYTLKARVYDNDRSFYASSKRIILTGNKEPKSVLAEYWQYNDLVLSPNPAKDYVCVSLSDNAEIVRVTIKSIYGVTYFDKAYINGEDVIINVSQIVCGVYLVDVIDVNGLIYTKKLLIK